MTPKISVIVPIYNAGEYLSRCLTSLSKQTLTDIEIICVLDCPTDGSDKVVKQYAQFDSRFVVVENEQNIGVAASRNKGIELAKGEYVGFSDHDDWHEPFMYEELYAKAQKTNADIVTSNTMVHYQDKEKTYSFADMSKEVMIQSILLPVDSPLCRNKLARSVWHSVYKTKFIRDNGITFYNRGDFFEEDTLFNCISYSLTGSVAHVNKVLYHWNLIRPNDAHKYDHSHSLQVFLNYLSVIMCWVKDKKLLTAIVTEHFYNYWSYYRKTPNSEVRNMMGDNVKYLDFHSLKFIYGDKWWWNMLLYNRRLMLKFIIYISILKCDLFD